MPIETIRHRGPKRLWQAGDHRGVPAQSAAKLARVMAVLDSAAEVSELDLFPGWRLHPLRGDLAGFWSITITGNWRLVFRFEGGRARDLDLVDYH